MNPILVSPPTADLISLDEMKAHLRVDGDTENALIGMLISGSVAYLDGWKGVLGRAIMPQTWQQTFACPGPYRLAMPDVTEATVTADGEVVTGTIMMEPLGPRVALPVSASEVVIEYTCALPVEKLPAVRVAAMLLVGHWFANRESIGDRGQEIPLGFDMLISSIRWRSV